MKQNLLFILIFFSLNLNAQTDIGIGLVSVSYNIDAVLYLYEKQTSIMPAKTIEFFNDETINACNIKNFKEHKEWLNPESLYLDYYSFVFRCIEKDGNWYKIIVNNETGKTLWLEKNELTTFLSWEIFLQDMFYIKRLSNYNQKIWKLPTRKSEEIKYTGNDCFNVKSMKDDWIEIYTSENCESSTKIKSGWIKWRNENKLLIEYFVTN